MAIYPGNEVFCEDSGAYQKWLEESYPATKDAFLVSKYFGGEISSAFNRVLAKGKEQDLLQAAKDMEQARLDKQKK